MEFGDLYETIQEATENEMCGDMDHEYPDGEKNPMKKPMDGEESVYEEGEPSVEGEDEDLQYRTKQNAADMERGEYRVEDAVPHMVREVGKQILRLVKDYQEAYPDEDFSSKSELYSLFSEQLGASIDKIFGGENGEEAQGEDRVDPDADVEEMAEKPDNSAELPGFQLAQGPHGPDKGKPKDKQGDDYKAMDAKKKYESRARIKAKAKKDPPAAKKE